MPRLAYQGSLEVRQLELGCAGHGLGRYAAARPNALYLPDRLQVYHAFGLPSRWSRGSVVQLKMAP